MLNDFYFLYNFPLAQLQLHIALQKYLFLTEL